MVSKIRIPALIRVEDAELQRYLDSLRQAVLDLSQIPFIQGVKVTNVALSTSVVKVNHKLGQKFTGAFALDGIGLIIDNSNPHPEREIWVSIGAGTSTTDIWVY